MKPSRMQLLLLIACLFEINAPVLAQTSTPPVTAAAAGGPSVLLPDAPSAHLRRSSPPPPSATGPLVNVEWMRDKHFVLMNSLMFGSSIANAELTTRCMNSGACSTVPGPLRSRGTLYSVGLPADVGVAALGYYLKRSGNRWWFVPAAVVTACNVVYGIHASRHIR